MTSTTWHFRGAETSSVVKLWGFKEKTLTSNISETVQNFAKRLSSEVGALGALRSAPTVVGVGVPLWGSDAPNGKVTFWYPEIFEGPVNFIDISYLWEYVGVKIFWDLKRNLTARFWENGVENFWGRGTFSSSPTFGAHGHTTHRQSFRGLRADKNAFERCRYLLPVWTYGGLKFSEGRNFGGKLLPM